MTGAYEASLSGLRFHRDQRGEAHRGRSGASFHVRSGAYRRVMLAVLAPPTTTAEWLTAIGTVGTLGMLVLQLTLSTASRARRARRAQAEQVSGWVGEREAPASAGREQRLELLNASHEPVYRAVVYLVFIQGTSPKTGMDQERMTRAQQPRTAGDFVSMLSMIPPGRCHTSISGNWAHMAARPGVELSFTDRSGVRWRRSSDGSLTRIKRPATSYYGIDGPYDWRTPEGS